MRHYRISSTVMLQNVDDEPLLFDSESGLFFSLNGTGTLFWDVICKHDTMGAVLEYLLEIYDVEKFQLERDLTVFVKVLYDQKLIHFDEDIVSS